MVYNPQSNFQSLHSGMLLIANPGLKDPNFEKSVILLSAHEDDEGAVGVVINKPLKKTLGECLEDFQSSPLSGISIYVGGPVQQNQLILAGWQWSAPSSDFQLFFGISQEKAIKLLECEPHVEIRGYLGFAGWASGQLEGEIAQNSWYKSPVDPKYLMHSKSPIALWRDMVRKFEPTFDGGLLDYPDDPSLN
jgi:putative transcriptional regulator